MDHGAGYSGGPPGNYAGAVGYGQPRRPYRWIGLAIALVLVLFVGGVGGWLINDSDSGSGADVSTAGRVAYVCALANDARAQGDVDSWKLAIGDKAGPAMRNIAAIAGLLGAPIGTGPQGYEGLKEPGQALFSSLTRVDVDGLKSSFNEIVSWCDSHAMQD